MATITPDGRSTWTRRAAVRCAMACAVAYVAPRKAVAESTLSGVSNDETSGIPRNFSGAELYAFPGARSGATVVAVTWLATRADLNSTTGSIVRLHAGPRSWSVKSHSGTTKRLHGNRMAVGFLPAESSHVPHYVRKSWSSL